MKNELTVAGYIGIEPIRRKRNLRQPFIPKTKKEAK